LITSRAAARSVALALGRWGEKEDAADLDLGDRASEF